MTEQEWRQRVDRMLDEYGKRMSHLESRVESHESVQRVHRQYVESALDDIKQGQKTGTTRIIITLFSVVGSLAVIIITQGAMP